MQTLISVFNKRVAAQRAVERLLRSGFAESDIHLQQPHEPRPEPSSTAENPEQLELGERVMESAEREVAVDPGVFEAIGKFFGLLFGRGSGAAGAYSEAVQRGKCVLVVDANDDHQAEAAAVILHEQGAIEVDDHRAQEVPEAMRSGVRAILRPEQPPLRDLVAQQHSR
jgi:hypothetical protein